VTSIQALPEGTAIRFPWRFLTLHLSYLCNNDCRFCITGPRDPSGEKLSVEAIDTFLRANGSADFDAVNLCGGEPTLYPALAQVISLSRQQGFRQVTMFTNGRRLAHRPYAEELVRAGVDFFTVSLHGPTAAIHDGLTRRPGSFGQALRAIRNLKALDQVVQVLCVVTRPNHGLLPEVLELAAGEGVDLVNFSGMCPYGQAAVNWEDVGVAYAEIRRELVSIAGALGGTRPGVVLEGFPFCVVNPFERHCVEYGGQRLERVLLRDRQVTDYDECLNATKSFVPQCRGCGYKGRCGGVYSGYLQSQGAGEIHALATSGAA
jgi:MoaA/NifB/PqqE/SkfB family radical SAM enzyme